jgi:hypothetical protein
MKNVIRLRHRDGFPNRVEIPDIPNLMIDAGNQIQLLEGAGDGGRGQGEAVDSGS